MRNQIQFLHWHPQPGRLLSQTFLRRISKVSSLIIISILGLKLSNISPPSFSSASNLSGPVPEGSFYAPSSEAGGESIGFQKDYLPQLEEIRFGRLVPPDQVGLFHILFWYLTILLTCGGALWGGDQPGFDPHQLGEHNASGRKIFIQGHWYFDIKLSILMWVLLQVRRTLETMLTFSSGSFSIHLLYHEVDNTWIRCPQWALHWTQEPPSTW